MINNFLVCAIVERNELKIILDGYFMKSELRLALYLAKCESKKLLPGFVVILDIRNLNSDERGTENSFNRFSRMIESMGGSSLKIVGLDESLKDARNRTVGFYPYKNA